MSIDPKQLTIGKKLPGLEWVLRGYLGQGGMGIVLHVEKPVGGRGVKEDSPGLSGAIKIIRPELAWRAEYVDGLFAEMRLLLKIEHPNIVRVLDVGCFPDGTPYVVMEKLNGGTLRTLLEHFGPLPLSVACQILFQANDALDNAHNEGIVHQDFKLDNVFVHTATKTSKPVIKVLDFGIAAFRKHGRSVMGTPKYMAPEQLRGEKVTPQTDIFASALVLYELLTGNLPYPVPPSNMVEARLHMDPLPPSHFKPQIPPELDKVILSALSRNPADRPPSSWKFSDQLYAFQYVQDDNPAEINDTAPSLMTLTDVVQQSKGAAGGEAEGPADDTLEDGATPPLVEGRSLELAPPELIERQSLAVRRRFTLRMGNAPALPPEAFTHPEGKPLDMPNPGAALHTPTDRISHGAENFPTLAPSPIPSVASSTPYPPGPAVPVVPSVIVERSSPAVPPAAPSPSPPLARAPAPPPTSTPSPRPSTADSGSTPSRGRIPSPGSVSGTSDSGRLENRSGRSLSRSDFARRSFLLPMAILLPLLALGAIVAARVDSSAKPAAARAAPPPATTAAPAPSPQPAIPATPSLEPLAAPPPRTPPTSSVPAVSSPARPVPPSTALSHLAPRSHAPSPSVTATPKPTPSALPTGLGDEWKLTP